MRDIFHSLHIVMVALVVDVRSLMTDEQRAREFFEEIGRQAETFYNKAALLSWAYSTNVTTYNSQQKLAYSEVMRNFELAIAENASMFDWQNFSDQELRIVFSSLSYKGLAVLPDKEFKEIEQVFEDMKTIYSVAKVCGNGNKALSMEPGLTELMATSKDYKELAWAWKSWRDATGAKMRQKYQRMVELSNKAAIANGRNDTGAQWRESYELDGYNFRENMESLYHELKPLYDEIHMYVRHKLKKIYGPEYFPNSGHIPAHLLGNMWAQNWAELYKFIRPFDDGAPIDAGPALEKMSIREIYEKADEFFTSLGLEPLSEEFWRNSMLEKPKDGRDVVCHASAWNFYNGTDFRIKQCTRKTTESFRTVHHEMGHIQYYAQYKHLNIMYRTGANPGFHEAVGDVLGLSVSTPKHLKAVGLIQNYTTNYESDINFLLKTALSKITFLPFGKLMDDYRWAIFEGNILPDNYNEEWWSKRCKYQGIFPPLARSEADFDAGAKYHIAANVRYVRYFVSYVLQFQFHEALCSAANHTGPLHTCDIYQSREAGQKLADMLKLGASVEWPEAMFQLTGTRELSARPLIQYFQPLIDWLKEANDKSGERQVGGWTDECPTNILELTVPSGVCKQDDDKNGNGCVTFAISLFIFIACFTSALYM